MVHQDDIKLPQGRLQRLCEPRVALICIVGVLSEAATERDTSMLPVEQSVATRMSLDQVDDKGDAKHSITDCLDLSMADHDATNTLQETCDGLGWQSWCTK